MKILVHKTNIYDLQTETGVCEILEGYLSLSHDIDGIFDDSKILENSSFTKSKYTIFLVFIVIIICYLVICFPYLLVFSILSFKELETILKLMQKVDSTIRNEASFPLKKTRM
jgi:hypothetical protein